MISGTLGILIAEIIMRISHMRGLLDSLLRDCVRTARLHVILRSPSVRGNIFSYQDEDDECISLLILEYA